MATFGRLRKNLDRNISPPYDNFRADVRGATSGVIAAILAVVIAFCMPAFALGLAVNIATRVPDTYSFELGQSNAAADANISNGAQEVSKVISSYMLHKTDSFQLTAEYQGRKKPVFTIGDGAAMQKLRNELDKTVIPTGAGLLLTALSIIILHRMGRYRLIRRSMLFAWILYILALGGLAFLYYDTDLSGRIWRDTFGIRLGTNDVLPLLFGRELFPVLFIVSFILSLVVFIVVHTLLRAITRDREMMFK